MNRKNLYLTTTKPQESLQYVRRNSQISVTIVVYFRATWLDPSQKKKTKKKFTPEKNSLYLRKWNFLALILKKNLISSQKKVVLIFSQKKAFLIFPETERCTFQPKLKKEKKPPREKFLKLLEAETPETLLIFSKKKAVIMFQEKATPKKFIIFQKTELPYISGKVYSEP